MRTQLLRPEDRRHEIVEMLVEQGSATLEALSEPLNAAFFKETVPGEIVKMIFRTGSVERLKPWVGLHHGGVRITTDELRLLLEAVAGSGLQSFIYWHYSDMTEAEWRVLREYVD